jgi:hypothetical protein
MTYAEQEKPADELSISYSTSEGKKQTPWLVFAKDCPWAQYREGHYGVRCSGTMDESGTYALCCESECAVYHFVKIMQEMK